MSHRKIPFLSYLVPLALASVAAGCGGPPAPGRVYVVNRPPPPRVEVPGAAPQGGWVWIPGRYRWERGNYLWEGGHWDRLPGGRRRWQPGHWAHARRGWFWVEGRWR